MKILRALGGSLLWIAAALLGLVGVLLCVTIVLLPLGLPVLWLARKLFRAAMAMLVPRKVRHPVAAAGDAVRDKAGDAHSATSSALKPLGKRLSGAADRGRSFLKHQRKRLA
jgi:hypothetical protein